MDGWALFVTYTIIQSIMRSEMCSLHLTHPSVHTWSSEAAQWFPTSIINQHIIMISEEHVTEDWRNDAENSALITKINYI